MKTISCPDCHAVNNIDESNCSNCAASLASVKFDQNIDELRQLTEKLRDFNAPRKSFSSFNGCGTMLLDYRALPDGKYEATRWVTIFYLPIVPLSGYVIEPTSQEFSYGRQIAKFSIVDKAPISLARVLRTYLLVVIGLAPVILGWLNSRTINHVLGGPRAFFAMLATTIWGGYIIFFKLKNDSKAYKKKKT
jgi:hypothetical protein